MTTDSSFKRKRLTFIKLCYACFFHPGVPLEKSRLLGIILLELIHAEFSIGHFNITKAILI